MHSLSRYTSIPGTYSSQKLVDFHLQSVHQVMQMFGGGGVWNQRRRTTSAWVYARWALVSIFPSNSHEKKPTATTADFLNFNRRKKHSNTTFSIHADNQVSHAALLRDETANPSAHANPPSWRKLTSSCPPPCCCRPSSQRERWPSWQSFPRRSSCLPKREP